MKVFAVRASVVGAAVAVLSVVVACVPPPDPPGPTPPPGPNGPVLATPGEVRSLTTDGKQAAVVAAPNTQVWDRTSGAVTPVVDTSPSMLWTPPLRGPVISGDGSKVAWAAYFSDNGVNSGNPRYGVTPAVMDRATGQSRPMPTAGIDTSADYADLDMPDDGSFVAVEFRRPDLGSFVVELAIWNLATDHVTYTGVTATQTYTDSGQVSVSNDGRFVQFERVVWDRQGGAMSTLTMPGALSYDNVGLSGNGRFFAFNHRQDASFTSYRPAVWDRQTGTILSPPAGADGQPFNGRTSIEGISDDGTVALVVSSASNVVAGDTNGQQDTFIWDLTANTFRRLLPGGVEPNGTLSGSQLSGNGRVVTGISYATNIGVNGPFIWTE